MIRPTAIAPLLPAASRSSRILVRAAAVLAGFALGCGSRPSPTGTAAFAGARLSTRAAPAAGASDGTAPRPALRLDDGVARVALEVDLEARKGRDEFEVELPWTIIDSNSLRLEATGVDPDEVSIEVTGRRARVSLGGEARPRGTGVLVFREPRLAYRLGHTVTMVEGAERSATAELTTSLAIDSTLPQAQSFSAIEHRRVGWSVGARGWQRLAVEPPLVLAPGTRLHRQVSALDGAVPARSRWTFDAIPATRANARLSVLTAARGPLEPNAAVAYEFELPPAALGAHRGHAAEILVFREGLDGVAEFLGPGAVTPPRAAKKQRSLEAVPREEAAARSSAPGGAGGKETQAVVIRVGQATALRAERKQRELTVRPAARLLLEEIAIELTNDSAVEATIVVRETMWRGLNWAIAYFNDAGSIAKEAAQRVRFEVTVPARAARTLVYRVAYTW